MPDTRRVLSQNLVKLMAQRGFTSLKPITALEGGSNGMLDRIRRGTVAANVDAIDRLAAVFGVQPWQLLAPGLGAELYVINDERRVVPVASLPPVPLTQEQRDRLAWERAHTGTPFVERRGTTRARGRAVKMTADLLRRASDKED